MAKSKSISLGIKGEPESFANVVKSKGSDFYFQGGAHSQIAPERLSKPALVISRLDHNVIISYDGEAMAVPPHGRVSVANMAKLGAIPRGVTVIPQ